MSGGDVEHRCGASQGAGGRKVGAVRQARGLAREDVGDVKDGIEVSLGERDAGRRGHLGGRGEGEARREEEHEESESRRGLSECGREGRHEGHAAR